MDRRALIGSLVFGALKVPRAASAQPARKVFRIGILNPGMTSNMGWTGLGHTTVESQRRWAAFQVARPA